MKLVVNYKVSRSPGMSSGFGPMRVILFKHTTWGFIHLCQSPSPSIGSAVALGMCTAGGVGGMKTVISKGDHKRDLGR